MKLQEEIEEILRFYRYGEIESRIISVLRLSENPMTQEEICEETGYSQGAVSSTLTKIEKMGFVKTRKKSRKKYYELKVDIFEIINYFMRDYWTKKESRVKNYIKQAKNSDKNTIKEIEKTIKKVIRFRKIVETTMRNIDNIDEKDVKKIIYTIKNKKIE